MRSRGGEIALLLLAGLGLAACTAGPEVARDPRPMPQRVEPPPTPEGARPVPDIREPADTPVLVRSVVKITGGDTIKVQLSSGPITVRFHSIDAPERDQPWGPGAVAVGEARPAATVLGLHQLSRAGQSGLCAHEDRRGEGRAVVLLGGRGAGGRRHRMNEVERERFHLDFERALAG